MEKMTLAMVLMILMDDYGFTLDDITNDRRGEDLRKMYLWLDIAKVQLEDGTKANLTLTITLEIDLKAHQLTAIYFDLLDDRTYQTYDGQYGYIDKNDDKYDFTAWLDEIIAEYEEE